MPITAPSIQPHHDMGGSMMTDQKRRDELVRLLLQSIQDLGYQGAMSALQKESGICLESSVVSDFRNAVRGGDWSKAEELLSFLTREDSRDQALFQLRRQYYLELLESRSSAKALDLLRTKLTPLNQDAAQLYGLTSLLLCSSAEEVKEKAEWDGAAGQSRDLLLDELQQFAKPSTMVPNERLPALLGQAFEYQRQQCLYHRKSGWEFSLFSDHVCDKKQFPSETIRILRGHTDEVWHVAFSNNGRYLASVSLDDKCLIWDLETYKIVHTLKGKRSSSYCTWSPDDTKLLVCDGDTSFQLWDTVTGRHIRSFPGHKEQVTSCAWLPDGEHFISGTCEKILQLYHIEGKLKEKQESRRFYDIKISKDGRRLVTISHSNHIGIYNLKNQRMEWVNEIPEEGRITCVSISSDGCYALVGIQGVNVLHLWNLDDQICEKQYSGHKNENYIIRSSFGGDDEGFVLCGSEDNRIFVWNREHEELLEVLDGHTGTVNCVAWCPTEPARFASASDDKTIRIWGLPTSDLMNET